MYLSLGICTEVRKPVKGDRVGTFKGGELELSGIQD